MSKRSKQPKYELAIVEDDAKAVTIKLLKPALSAVAAFEQAELHNDWDAEITERTDIGQFVADLNERFEEFVAREAAKVS